MQVAPDLLHQFFLGQVRAYVNAVVAHLQLIDPDKVAQFDRCFVRMPAWHDFAVSAIAPPARLLPTPSLPLH